MTKVLVVDDEWDIRELLVDTILDAGLEVIEAGDGETALQRVAADHPDIVLLDIWMPGMDGLQVLEKLRENPATARLPVVLLTAMPAWEGERAGLSLGVTHYLNKPWESGAIESTIRVTMREAELATSGGDQTVTGSSAPSGGDQTVTGNSAPSGGDQAVTDNPAPSGGEVTDANNLAMTTDSLVIKAGQVIQYASRDPLAALRSGRKKKKNVLDDSGESPELITTGGKLPALDLKMAGGLPLGTVNLAVGAAASGKSVLCQHLVYGALQSKYGVAYFSSESGPDDLATQMASIGLNVTKSLRANKISVHPVPEPSGGEEAVSVLNDLARAIESRSRASQLIVVDSITDLAGSCPEQSVIGFFSALRSPANEGKTVLISIHSYAFGSEMFYRLRTLCDGYFSLSSEQVGGKALRTLEVNKINTTEQSRDNMISFVVEREVGMRLIPVVKSRV